MFYKYNKETEEWYTGLEVHFPDGVKINTKNKITKDGWEWHDTEPPEYKLWILKQPHERPI